MKILILDNDRYQVESKVAPEVGRYYTLEDAATGTQAQNRAFHSLLIAFWKWMDRTDSFRIEGEGRFYDLTTPSAEAFKDFWKYQYGEGFSYLNFVNDKNQMERAACMEEIPLYALEDFNAGNRGRIKGVLKSWADYTKVQRRNCIDTLKRMIILSECDDKKVREIMDGMESE